MGSFLHFRGVIFAPQAGNIYPSGGNSCTTGTLNCGKVKKCFNNKPHSFVVY